MSTPAGFARRICAMLLADVSGYSALVGADDARTALAVHQLQEVVGRIVAEAGGRSEPRAGDAVFAIFDSVAAAVESALAILRCVRTEEFTGTRLEVRIGVHFGDILLREGASFGEAVGDAINIAARLQGLAKPGTICISDGVYRHVRNKLAETFVDLGQQRLRNISDPVHAYLVIPREAAAEHRSPGRVRRIAWGTGAAFATLLAAGALVVYRRLPPVAAPFRDRPAGELRAVSESGAPEVPTEQMTLGVMGFKTVGDGPPDDWRRDALRDGLNTQLSRLSHVKVYSKEFIDFLISRKGLTEIEAATQLGIQKMLSGSLGETKGTMQIEIHVVDVQTGVLEASYSTSGSDENFLDLQNKLALGVISHLNLPVSDSEKQILVAQQSTDVDALKRLLEAEGGVAVPQPTPPGPRSALSPDSWWLADAAAFADERDTAQEAIRAVLDRYKHAMEGRELSALAGLYTEFPPELQAAQQRYFDNVRDLRVAFDNVDIAVVGDEAVVSYTRTDDFTDARTGRAMHVAVRVTKMLRQSDGNWKLTAQ